MSARSRAVFIHPLAVVETSRIGAGTRIWAHAHVMAHCRLGRECNIGEGVFLETREPVGDYTVIKNGVSIWDKVSLADRVFVGPDAAFTNDRLPRADPRFKAPRARWEPTTVRTNATIVCGVVLGRWCLVGAGAVVTGDVPDYQLVLGNPARPHGFVCECGRRLPPRLLCRCGRRYRPKGASITPIRGPARKPAPARR